MSPFPMDSHPYWANRSRSSMTSRPLRSALYCSITCGAGLVFVMRRIIAGPYFPGVIRTYRVVTTRYPDNGRLQNGFRERARVDAVAHTPDGDDARSEGAERRTDASDVDVDRAA